MSILRWFKSTESLADKYVEVSDSNPLPVAASLPAVASAVLLSPTGGSKDVAAAGTAEPLVAASTKRSILYVRAKAGNTGNIYLGDSNVDNATSTQIVLAAGQSVTLTAPAGYCLDVNQFYIDAAVNGEGVEFLYV